MATSLGLQTTRSKPRSCILSCRRGSDTQLGHVVTVDPKQCVPTFRLLLHLNDGLPVRHASNHVLSCRNHSHLLSVSQEGNHTEVISWQPRLLLNMNTNAEVAESKMPAGHQVVNGAFGSGRRPSCHVSQFSETLRARQGPEGLNVTNRCTEKCNLRQAK